MPMIIKVNGVVHDDSPDPGDGTVLQSVINEVAADNGANTISLEGGQTITRAATISLPTRSSATDWLTIETDGIDLICPPDTEVLPEHGPDLAHFISTGINQPCISWAANANYYRLRGIWATDECGDVTNAPPIYVRGDSTGTAQFPNHVHLDRILGDHSAVPDIANKYWFITFFAHNVEIENCHINDFTCPSSADADYGAIWWAAGSNVWIHDNYCEAGGETIFIGNGPYYSAGDKALAEQGLIERNFVTWNMAWQDDDDPTIGLKNQLEIKNGKDITIRGNYFYNSWASGQVSAIVISLRTESTGIPHAEMKRILFKDNVIERCATAIDISGMDGSGYDASGALGGGVLPSEDVVVENNLVFDCTDDQHEPGGSGAGFQGPFRWTLGGTRFAWRHNTAITQKDFNFIQIFGRADLPDGQDKWHDPAICNNLMSLGGTAAGDCFHQFDGSGQDHGDVITTWFVDLVMRGNVFAEDGEPSSHGAYNAPMNTFDVSPAELLAEFRDPENGDFQLNPLSPYKGAAVDDDGNPTGKDLGANLSQIYDAMGDTLWSVRMNYTPDPLVPVRAFAVSGKAITRGGKLVTISG